MSTNDFSIDQLELLNISQHNLNMNLNNKKLLDNLISTGDSVTKSLKEKYGDMWNATSLS